MLRGEGGRVRDREGERMRMQQKCTTLEKLYQNLISIILDNVLRKNIQNFSKKFAKYFSKNQIDWQFIIFWCLIISLLASKYFEVVSLNQQSGHNFHNGKEVFYLGRQLSDREKNHEHGYCQMGGVWAISVVLGVILEGFSIFLKVTTVIFKHISFVF